jgi:O-antigen/teichoic acid export membrane protein
MIAILAKIGTAEMVGQYALGLAVTAPLMLLAGMQLGALQVTDATGQFSFRDYLRLRVFTAAAALGVLAAMVLAMRLRIETALIVSIVGASKAVDSITDVYLSEWQRCERMMLVAAVWVVNAVCTLVLFGFGVAVSGGAVWGVVGALAGSVIAFCVALQLTQVFSRGDEVASPARPGSMRRLIRAALPLGGVGALLSLNVNVPRYFVQHYLGESALGLFAAAAYPMVLGDILVGSMAQSVSPRMARFHAARNGDELKTLLARLTLTGIIVGCAATTIAAFAGRRVLTLLYRPEYAAESVMFTLVVAAISVRYSYAFIGVAVTAMRHFLVQLYLRIAVLVCVILISPPMIVSFGLVGAAATLVIVNVLEGAAWAAIGYACIWRPTIWPSDGLMRPEGSPGGA